MIRGIRCYPDSEGELWLPEYGYGQGRDGMWYARPPGASMSDLDGWIVEEHEDRTITVMPSIDTGNWHGWLVQGYWQLTQ